MGKNDGLKLSTLLILAFLLLFACSHFLVQRHFRFEREKVASDTLYEIHQAQAQFKTTQGRYGTLVELAEAGLVKAGLAWSANSYWRYWVSDLTSTTFRVHADRKSTQASNCDFNLSEDGVLYSRCSKDIGSVPPGQGAVGRR